jgi:hypothetical protein
MHRSIRGELSALQPTERLFGFTRSDSPEQFEKAHFARNEQCWATTGYRDLKRKGRLPGTRLAVNDVDAGLQSPA